MTQAFFRVGTVKFLLASLFLAGFFTWSSSARAGTYNLYVCDYATSDQGVDLTEYGTGLFTYVDNSSRDDAVSHFSQCPSNQNLDSQIMSTELTGDGLGVWDNPNRTSTGSVALDSYYIFQPPSGTSISAAKLNYYLGKASADQLYPYIQVGSETPLTCTISGPNCEDGDGGGKNTAFLV